MITSIIINFIHKKKTGIPCLRIILNFMSSSIIRFILPCNILPSRYIICRDSSIICPFFHPPKSQWIKCVHLHIKEIVERFRHCRMRIDIILQNGGGDPVVDGNLHNIDELL